MMRSVKEMRHVYRDFLLETNHNRQDIAVLEADLSSSMGTHQLGQSFGKRYINVGIMEAQMVGLAAGLSIRGYRPYLHTFGPFATRRVFDQVFLSLGYAQLGATIVGSDAGVSAEMNGGTHMPFEELALMRSIPKAHVFEVSDDVQFRAILNQTLSFDGLNYIRTIRKKPIPIYEGDEDFSKGFMSLKEGKDLTLVASGIMVTQALKAAEQLEKLGYQVGVIDLFQIKPLPRGLKDCLLGKPVVTVENHNRIGGIGSAICELLSQENDTPITRIGIDESFGQVGKMEYLLEVYGLTAGHIVTIALKMLEN